MSTERDGSPPGHRPPIHRTTVVVAAVLMAVALPLASCGTPSGSASTTTATEIPTTSPPVDTTRAAAEPATTSTSGPSVLSSITSAVVAFESRRGLPSGHYVIRGVTLSTDDPTWAKFEIDAPPGYGGTFQSAYGIAHDAGQWRVIGIGSSGVGCGGPHAVPAATLDDLGLTCP